MNEPNPTSAAYGAEPGRSPSPDPLRELVESGLTYAEAEAALPNVTSLPPVPWGPKGPPVEDTAAFVGTCDMGECSRSTEAVVLTDDGWLSSCRPCAGTWAVCDV